MSVMSKKSDPMMRCAGCGEIFDRTISSAMPFCSENCRSNDLDNWLTESYGLPHEGEGVADRVELEDEDQNDQTA